tara:strand:+ start:262 stop:666 length:405 start_codon:yes stop_codon:yes gene_type:complete
LRTNHNVRIVTLTTAERVLALFGEIRENNEPEAKVIGYTMNFPYLLRLGEVRDDGNIPIEYTRWCPFSPIEEHRLSGEHIISVVYPDNGILDNFVTKLKEVGLTDEQIFFPQEPPNGNTSEPTQTEQPVADSPS